MSSRIPRLISILFSCAAAFPSCVEENVRLYVEVTDSCRYCCDDLQFKVLYDDVDELTLEAGQRVLLEHPPGSNGKLTVSAHQKANKKNHPLKCQKCVNSKINVQGWTVIPDDEAYVYYNHLIYFQNEDIHVNITCHPPSSITNGACDDVYCYRKPANFCERENVLDRIGPKGSCAEGKCIYPSTAKICWAGWCYEGACSSAAPCEDVYCHFPPAPQCNGEKILEFASEGVCIDGHCWYDGWRTDCDTLGIPCESNEDGCYGGTCEAFRCDKPPANHCVDHVTLRSFSPRGRCVIDSDGEPSCEYTPTETECIYGCDEGTCLGYACANVTCNMPPASYCDRNTLITFEDIGYCSDGNCTYRYDRIICNGGCLDGQCEDRKQQCEVISCNNPPTPYCLNNSTLRVYDTNGECNDEGFCIYHSYEDIPCGNNSCINGRCKDAPCLGELCNVPPTNYCLDDNTIMKFPKEGVCDENGQCLYKGEEVDCSEGCKDGWCP